MTPSEQAAAHDANMVGFFRQCADVLQRSSQASYGPIPVVVLGIPAPFFNGAWLLEPAEQGEIEAALDHLRGSGMPFVVHLGSDLPNGSEMLAPFGLEAGGVLPCFAMEPGPVPTGPTDLEMRPVGAAEWDDFLATTASSFGMPPPMVEALYVPAMLELPGLRAFVGYVDGRPVATAISARTGTTVGVYSIGTIPEARGHGYGTAATWHLLRDADPGWEVAVLQASEMGRPIYERMGFELVREFVEYGVPTPG